MRQNDIEKIMVYQKCFIGPLVWKYFTNDFELLLSENYNLKILPKVKSRVCQNDKQLWRTKNFLLAHWFENVPK